MTAPRDPRIAPERGDYLVVSPRRHVRVESVTQTDDGTIVRLVVSNPHTEVHHVETMPLDDFRADARDATVRWAYLTAEQVNQK